MCWMAARCVEKTREGIPLVKDKRGAFGMNFKQDWKMKEKKKLINPRWKSILVFGLFLLAVLWQAGCVDISDTKVQVEPPGKVDQYNRSIVDQCTPHVMPHHLIQASISAAVPNLQPGSGTVLTDQTNFDILWTDLTVQLDQNQVMTQNLKPVIDWTQQAVYVYYVLVDSSCEKVKPYGDGMITDCYNVTAQIYKWTEGEDCGSTITSYPVLVYIFPNVDLPVGVQWFGPTATFTPTSTPTSTPSSTQTPTPTSENDE